MTNTDKTFQKYLAINEAATNWGIVCTTIGFQDIPVHGKYPLLQHPSGYTFSKDSGRILSEYQLLYIVEGKGTFRSASHRESEVGAGSVILLYPGEWHSYYPNPEIGWSEYWVGFKGDYIDRIISSGFFSKESPITRLGYSAALAEQFREINRVAEKEKTGFQPYIAGIIMNMLGYIFYKQKNIEYVDNPIVEKINLARSIMREKITENISPTEIAIQLGIGYTWFRRTFKEYVGSSPGQYQLQLKHLKAKELLNIESNSISDICFELGFENISQFSTFFKKHEGISASEYRKNIFQ